MKHFTMFWIYTIFIGILNRFNLGGEKHCEPLIMDKKVIILDTYHKINRHIFIKGRGSMKKLVILSIVSILSCFLLFGGKTTEAASGKKQLIIINKSTNQLAFYENNQLQRSFSVGTGRQASYTPEGTFKIVKKIVNRPYYKGKIKGGDPRNPLGKRWLGINARQTKGDTYAIHGNSNPSSIGKYVSSGCIRMYNDDVVWLYSKVNYNTSVIITTSSKTFTAIAASKGYQVKGNPASKAVSIGGVLKKGSSGPQVVTLQKKLEKLGYHVNGIDGFFGPGTEKAVKSFQKAKKLKADGIVGGATKKALGL